ncbi:HAMP domain-containing sensor histidine kinase [Paenibacillus lemnae]|uniref:histidine kinase n=1 Tax=Paenibacillus lemnae TaxID=1330551 RepID=A0A848M8C9_PAELE|nr:HAMP domain-containing sensor histidine kinase [Paenibacillus lemnae]NMO96450.1 HAMP domain-containing histidine kinase [Paenibacillus lemnae]
MRLKVWAVVFFGVITLGFGYSWQQLQQMQWDSGVDIVAVNDVVKIAEREWGRLDQQAFADISFDYAVLDMDGAVLLRSTDGISTTVYDAIANRDTVADVMKGQSVVGKVIIPSTGGQAAQQTAANILTMAALVYAAAAAAGGFYWVYLNRTIISPFRQLQQFAQHVARGHLDLPLTMDRHNRFGAFTESFDLMRDELAAARQSEFEANQSKKELVASLSHDIKTPLSSIKAVSELMLVMTQDEKQQKQLRTIYHKAEQINLLVTDMFHATLEELEQLNVEVNETYSSVLSDMLDRADMDNRLKYEPIPEVMLLTDEGRLQQVLDNVLSNSYKYAGTPVTIEFSMQAETLDVTISDDGPGVPEEEMPLLFNKFYRGRNAENKSGAGLGLYISKYLMNRMGGGITCRNREGGGFTVTLSLRLA